MGSPRTTDVAEDFFSTRAQNARARGVSPASPGVLSPVGGSPRGAPHNAARNLLANKVSLRELLKRDTNARVITHALAISWTLVCCNKVKQFPMLVGT